MRQGCGGPDGYNKRNGTYNDKGDHMDWYYYREILNYMREWRTMMSTESPTDLNWSSNQDCDKDARGTHGSARFSWGKELDGMAE